MNITTSIKSVSEKELLSIAGMSLRNCHAYGLDSVVFDNTPGARIRAFITHNRHTMGNNNGAEKLSIALHSHHCDIRLEPIFGPVFNMVPYESSALGKFYEGWKYSSKILSGKGGFESTGETKRYALLSEKVRKPIHMKASEQHTVYVPSYADAAWYVFEGAEDPNYDSTCWSDRDLSRFDFSGLYQSMGTTYLRELLNKMKIEVTQ
jgi:hypothetical protein